MRIVHISSVHNLTDPRFVLKMCPSLVKAGHEVHIVIPDTSIPSYLDIKNLYIHLLPKPKNRFERIFKTAKLSFKIASKLNGDIYHFHDPEGLLFAAIWQNKLIKPYIYDIHENYPDDILTKKWLPSYTLKCISYTFKKFEHIISSRLSGLVAATDFIASRFISHKNLITIHNYPLLDEFNVNLTDSYHKISGQFLYAGAISELRGIHEMIKAVSISNNNAHIAIAGHFIGKINNHNSLILNKFPRVIYYGSLDRNKLKIFMQQSIAGLVLFHPDKSHINALPNKIFEYMSASLPIIASDFPLWRNIVDKYNCGLLIDPLDPKSIANAMNYFIDNPDIAIQMGKNGRIAVEKEFNWDNEFPKLLKLYNNLV